MCIRMKISEIDIIYISYDEPNAEIRVQGANVKIESVNTTGKIKSIKTYADLFL